MSGTVHLEPIPKLYQSHLCMASNGIAAVKPDEEFRMLVANFGDHPRDLRVNQQVAKADPNPKAIVETGLTHGELCGIAVDDKAIKRKQQYRKSDATARDQ